MEGLSARAEVEGNRTTTVVSSSTTERLDPNEVGIIAGVVTFVIITILFGIAATVAMWRLRKKIPTSLQAGLAQHRNLFLIPSMPNQPTYQTSDETKRKAIKCSKHKAMKASIAARHYLKNGFHVTIDDDSPAKRKLTKVKSVPPALQDRDGIVIENKLNNNSSPVGEELLLKRVRSLKVERSPAHSSPDTLTSRHSYHNDDYPPVPQKVLHTNTGNTLTVPAFNY